MTGHPDSKKPAPGEHVRWYAQKHGWSLARNNIMVEGITDERYLHLAAKLYERQHAKQLLENVSIFAAGPGNEGGTHGVIERFPPLHRLIQMDVGLDEKALYRTIALLDNDAEGNNTCKYLTGRYTNLREHCDVFVLRRIFPQTTRDPKLLEDVIKKANEHWKTLDCEIEDLVHLDLITTFVDENPTSIRRAPIIINGAHHCSFEAKGKSDFCRWVESSAVLADLQLLVDLLRSLRYYLGLNPF